MKIRIGFPESGYAVRKGLRGTVNTEKVLTASHYGNTIYLYQAHISKEDEVESLSSTPDEVEDLIVHETVNHLTEKVISNYDLENLQFDRKIREDGTYQQEDKLGLALDKWSEDNNRDR